MLQPSLKLARLQTMPADLKMTMEIEIDRSLFWDLNMNIWVLCQLNKTCKTDVDTSKNDPLPRLRNN